MKILYFIYERTAEKILVKNNCDWCLANNADEHRWR
jgi:hypothetical protein